MSSHSPARPRARLGLAAIAISLAACATSNPSGDGIETLSPDFATVLDAGMAVLPVGHVDPVVDSGEVAAFLSNQLYLSLLVNMRGVPLVSPDDVLAQMRTRGEVAFDRFREVRRAYVRGEQPEREELSELNRIVLHRYLLITWVDEEKEVGLENVDQEYVERGHSLDVRRATYEIVRGRLTGIVVDLWEAETVWKGSATYATQKLYGKSESMREEVELARVAGVERLARMLGGHREPHD